MSDIVIPKVSGPDFVRKLNANGEVLGFDGVTVEGIDCSAGAAVVTCDTANCSNSRLLPDGTAITINNFESLEFNMESPAGDFPIPETEDFGNILVKAEGNRLSINVSWTLTCLADINGNPCTPDSLTCDACSDIYPVNTVAKQLDYLLNVFQPYSIEAKYRILVDGIARQGYIRRISFTKSAATPVTYTAALDFIAGDAVASE